MKPSFRSKYVMSVLKFDKAFPNQETEGLEVGAVVGMDGLLFDIGIKDGEGFPGPMLKHLSNNLCGPCRVVRSKRLLNVRGCIKTQTHPVPCAEIIPREQMC